MPPRHPRAGLESAARRGVARAVAAAPTRASLRSLAPWSLALLAIGGPTAAPPTLADETVIDSSVTSLLQGVIGAGQSSVTLAPAASIEADTSGIQLLRGVIDDAGSIGGGVFGIDAVESIEVLNSGSIASGTFGISNGGSIRLVNRERMEGGASGVSAGGDVRAWNWGEIEGGTFGLSVSDDLDRWNWGRIAGGQFAIITDGPTAVITNFATIDGPGTAIRFSGGGSPLLVNHGFVGGGRNAVELGGGGNGVLTLSGTGFYRGGVVGSPATATRSGSTSSGSRPR